MKETIVVIGAGASGLYAAIHAVNDHTNVILLEHKDRVGKKILMTGNGKCNLTNMSDLQGKYYSDHLPFVYDTLQRYNAQQTRDFFRKIGMHTKEKRDGGVYPVSEQAATVLDFLRMECDRLGIKTMTNCHVDSIEPKNDGGIIQYTDVEKNKKNTLSYDAVIISTGGRAAPVAGSDGSGYDLVKKLGHSLITPLPALVQLRCQGDFFKAVSGVRVQAILNLYVEGKKVASEEGELQLTDYGISGIPTFQISRIVAKALQQKKECNVHVNFVPYFSDEDYKAFLNEKIQFGYKTLEEYLYGVTHKKIAMMICKLMKVKPDITLDKLSQKQWKDCLDYLTDFSITVVKTNPFENAQVCCGGVPLTEIDENMQSKKHQNIYLTGELLDCDGICGGYNLQWAWATGAIAGKHAAARER